MVRTRFAPSQVLIRHEEETGPATPLAQGRPAQSGKTAAYVCVRGTCQLPLNEPQALGALLDRNDPA